MPIDGTPGDGSVSLAVATPEEAAKHVSAITGGDPGWRAMYFAGGTVGPLPDGTTIDVEELPWYVIAKLAGCSHDVVKAALISRDFAPVIAAFNAKQEG
jgi:hypothetical protein